MKIPSKMPRLKGFRFLREIIAYAVWVYHCFALSTADVQNLLAERGVLVSRETIRQWMKRFGHHFSDCIRRDRPGAADKCHLDEVLIPFCGRKYWLWRAVDANGDVLDILVQPQRNARAVRQFLTRLIARFGEPRVMITDKLRSYIKPIRDLASGADHRAHKGLNNRIEGSHRPTRKREKLMGRFKSPGQSQRFLAAHDQINTIFHPRRLRPLEYLCDQNGRLTDKAPATFQSSENKLAIPFLRFRSSPSHENLAENSSFERPSFQGEEHA